MKNSQNGINNSLETAKEWKLFSLKDRTINTEERKCTEPQ